jgi:hypothetical protein
VRPGCFWPTPICARRTLARGAELRSCERRVLLSLRRGRRRATARPRHATAPPPTATQPPHPRVRPHPTYRPAAAPRAAAPAPAPAGAATAVPRPANPMASAYAQYRAQVCAPGGGVTRASRFALLPCLPCRTAQLGSVVGSRCQKGASRGGAVNLASLPPFAPPPAGGRVRGRGGAAGRRRPHVHGGARGPTVS